MFHVPGISDSEIGHVDGGDSYSDCVNLAQTNSTWAPLNTHSLQFFAAEVYANTVAAPGVGCLGSPSADSGHAAPAARASPSASAAHDDHAHSDHVHDHASTSAGATPTAAAAGLAPSPTVRRSRLAFADPRQESVGCQPHDDHWQCVGARRWAALTSPAARVPDRRPDRFAASPIVCAARFLCTPSVLHTVRFGIGCCRRRRAI